MRRGDSPNQLCAAREVWYRQENGLLERAEAWLLLNRRGKAGRPCGGAGTGLRGRHRPGVPALRPADPWPPMAGLRPRHCQAPIAHDRRPRPRRVRLWPARCP